jgi:hypothetical protein
MSSRATQPLDRASFWKPVLDRQRSGSETVIAPGDAETTTATEALESSPEIAHRHDLCSHCGTEFVVDSPYCRMCGKRNSESLIVATPALRALDFRWLQAKMGLTAGALVSLFTGLMCMIVAAAVGSLYTATSYTDWQAIQTWRMEWLMAAGVAFLCGILLKRR